MGRSGGPTVGLDIGSHSIKVAEVVPGKGGPTVRALAMAPTPQDAVDNNVIIDPILMGQAVKQLLKEGGISVKSSVSSVSGQTSLVVRVITLPNMAESELAETMRWEVDRHVPFATEEMIMQYQRIQRMTDPPDAPEMEVFLAVAQQNMIDQHVAMLTAAGLTPLAIDVEPLAVSRTFIDLAPDPSAARTVAVVNIGHQNTDISIFRDGVLSFPRNLPMAGESLTRSLMAQMGLSDTQAEDYKRAHAEIILDQVAPAPAADSFFDFAVPESPVAVAAAVAPRGPFDFSEEEGSDTAPANLGQSADTQPGGFSMDEPVDTAPDFGSPTSLPAVTSPPAVHDPVKLQVFAAIAPVLSELITEVRRSLEYYRGRMPDAVIDEIILCGGSARVKNLDKFFEQELGIRTRVGSAFEMVGISAKNMSAEYIEEVAPAFAVAVGLAVRDMVSVPVPAAAGKRRGKKK